MILKASIFVIGLLARSVLLASIDCSIDQCAKPSKFYEELGCKAVYGAKSCCAKRFECPDFKKLDDNKCTFEGKEYKIGEILPRNFTSTTKCVETCFCTREDNEPAKFACSKNDCGVSSFKVPGCINIYGDLNECCSTSVVCDEAEKKSLASCFVGKEYREGEKFVPETNPCYECLCHKDFDNTTITDNLHCRKLNCEIDLRYKSFVQQGCLPVFHSEKCCPVDWKCPKVVKKIVKRSADVEDEAPTQAPKQNVFVVTPSKNLEEYLDIVKLANRNDDDDENLPTTVSPTLVESSVSAKVVEIVTEPSKDISNSSESAEEAATTTESHKDTLTVPTTKESPGVPVNIPSVNPFIVPVDQVEIPVNILIDDTDSFEGKASLTTVSIETSTAAASTTTLSSSSLSVADELLNKISETSSVQTTSAITTTPKNKTDDDDSVEDKSSEEDSSEENKDDKKTNLFGENIDKEEKLPTVISITTEPATTESSVGTKVASTTIKALKEELSEATVEQEITTMPTIQTTTTEVSTAPTFSKEPKVGLGRELKNEVFTSAPVTEIPVTTFSGIDSLPVKEPTTENKFDFPYSEKSTTPKAFLENSPSLTSASITVASITEAPATVATLSEASPTAFEELLTTLRQFVAKYDATIDRPRIEPREAPLHPQLSKPLSLPEPPKPISLPEPPKSLLSLLNPVSLSEFEMSTSTPELPEPAQPISIPEILKPVTISDALLPIILREQQAQQVEFVNFTVSMGDKSEEPKSIFKRSVPDVDLIPRYFKQAYSTTKDKSCVFNSKIYKLGEVIKTDNDCLKCICEYAPIGHCILKEKCSF